MYSKSPFSLHSFYQSYIRFSMLRLLKFRAPKISSCYTIFKPTGASLLSRCTHFTNPHIRFSMLRLLKFRAPKISSCYTVFHIK